VKDSRDASSKQPLFWMENRGFQFNAASPAKMPWQAPQQAQEPLEESTVDTRTL
jgi:hypothetical protein